MSKKSFLLLMAAAFFCSTLPACGSKRIARGKWQEDSPNLLRAVPRSRFGDSR
jgi:hypothetical protein